MCGPYWNQWDRYDLDSWQGKDYQSHDEVDGSDEKVDGRDCDCGNCMECLGMSWRDFM